MVEFMFLFWCETPGPEVDVRCKVSRIHRLHCQRNHVCHQPLQCNICCRLVVSPCNPVGDIAMKHLWIESSRSPTQRTVSLRDNATLPVVAPDTEHVLAPSNMHINLIEHRLNLELCIVKTRETIGTPIGNTKRLQLPVFMVLFH